MNMNQENETNTSCYKDGWEHLNDELTKLDLLVHLQVLRFRNLFSQTSNNTDGLSGLVIKDEDVDRLMVKNPKNREERRIKEVIDQVESKREEISKKLENSLNQEIYLPFYHLARLFQLTFFEMDIILVCLASEVNIKYEKLYAYIQDDVTKKSPSVNLILDLLCITPEERTNARTCFFSQSPLLKYNIIKFTGDNESYHKSLLSRHLKLDDRIVNYLHGFNVMDSNISSLAKILPPRANWTKLLLQEDIKESFRQLAGELVNKKAEDQKRIVIYLKGPYGSGKKSTAEAFCGELQMPIIIINARDLLNIEHNFEGVLRHLFREALLQPAAIYLEHVDRLIIDNPKGLYYQDLVIRAVEEYSFITFLAGEAEWSPPPEWKKHFFMEVALGVPAYPIRKRLWQWALNGNAARGNGVDIDAIAIQFRFTGGQIHDAVSDAQKLATIKSKNDNDAAMITFEDLSQGCRLQCNRKLSELAQKITPKYTWPDIVLPADELQQLKEMCNYVKHRYVVYNDWGFDRKVSLGKGLNILFSGPSGTGKTMAAEIIANELKLDCYKIDLSLIVSKYIGETEKNISKIFKEAETSNCILFFDEADALFGKRSEVKDSHDRYANIEINYLLQKMEEHEGIVILATNYRKNIDEAFTRRMHFSLDFPFPDREYRKNIWEKIFPAATPRSVDIDYEFLAKQFKISGGAIKNIALNAAFLAAGNSGNVDMNHIIHAAKREFQKMGKLCTQSEFGKYYHLVSTQHGGNQ
jgi:SpoVK/Ycf46/Vps4 family AAA+-type ATPase